MAYRLKLGRRIDKAFSGVIQKQIARAIRSAEARNTAFAERVRRARTSCKRIRAALRLVRWLEPKMWSRENASFRAAARELAALRDAAVLPQTLSGLAKTFGKRIDGKKFAALRRELLAHRRRISGDPLANEGVVARFIDRMREAERRWAKLEIKADATRVITVGFGEAHRRVRRAWSRADRRQSTKAFHDYRKRLKDYDYQHRLLGCAWPAVMREWQVELHAVSAWLGEEHDLAVLDDWLESVEAPRQGDKTVARVRALVRARRRELRKHALLAGERLFAEKPRAVARRLKGWWQAAAGLDAFENDAARGRA